MSEQVQIDQPEPAVIVIDLDVDWELPSPFAPVMRVLGGLRDVVPTRGVAVAIREDRVTVLAALCSAPEPRSTPGPSTGTPEPPQAASEACGDEVTRLREAATAVIGLCSHDEACPAWDGDNPCDPMVCAFGRLLAVLASVDAPAPDEADVGGSELPQIRAAIEQLRAERVAAPDEADEPECACYVTPESTWLSAASCGYGSGYEPGSQMEWNPDCPVHPGTPAAAPASDESR